MLGIKVYNELGESYMLDLPIGASITIEELLPAFDRNLEQGLFSFPIDIPFTPGNMNFFKHMQNMNSISGTIPDYWRCDVLDDGIVEIGDCKLKILNNKGRWDNTFGTFPTIITGAKGLFGSIIKGKKLKDLSLGGIIKWSSVMDSREFAKHVMDGNQPLVSQKLSFAPVYIEDFFDNTSENYAGELLNNSVVNNVILNVGYSNGWIFGKNATINTKVNKNVATYEQYRTIPFFKLVYVIKQIGVEYGYMVTGNFFDYPDIDKVYIFNNRSIEKYDYPFLFDVNTQINPVDHVPDMLIVEFLVAIQNAFNLKIDFYENKRIELNFNFQILNSSSILDTTSKTIANYDDSIRNEAFDNGYKLGWTWDSNDSYPTDRIKKKSELNIIATVTLYSDILGLSFGFPLEDSHYILVKAENYIYNYVSSSGNWIPVFENNEEYLVGRGIEEIKPNISTLCSYYSTDGTGTYSRRNMVATRQRGSYWSNNKSFVASNFGLRIFFIKTVNSGSYTNLPISFNHNYDAAGNKLTSFSLNWQSDDGLYNLFYKLWLQILIDSWIVKAKLQLDKVDLSGLKRADLIKIAGVQFIKKKQSYTIPVSRSTSVELVRL